MYTLEIKTDLCPIKSGGFKDYMSLFEEALKIFKEHGGDEVIFYKNQGKDLIKVFSMSREELEISKEKREDLAKFFK